MKRERFADNHLVLTHWLTEILSMAALNWTMLDGGRPVPLPGEKWLYTSSPNSIDVSLFPHPPGSPLNIQPKKDEEIRASRGTLYVSQKRVVYVAAGASSAGSGAGQAGPSSRAAEGTGSLASGQASIAPGGLPQEAAKKVPLQSLSVPLRYFVDGRFVQPWFSATYYEAMCLEGDKSGGLEVRYSSVSARATQSLTARFSRSRSIPSLVATRTSRSLPFLFSHLISCASTSRRAEATTSGRRSRRSNRGRS